MEIRKVAVVGAGAIGAYVIWGLADLLGDDLLVIAEILLYDFLAQRYLGTTFGFV